MSKNPIRICLAGLGRAGNFHMQSLRLMDEAVVSCVYDTDQAKAQSVADHLGCVAATSNMEAIHRDDVDAVIVATPTDFHFEFVQQSLEARKPTLTEKPLGRHLHEIDDCFNKAKECDTPLFVAFQRRFDPSFSSLVNTVHDGGIGQLQFVRSVSRDNPVPSIEYIRTSGGIFHDCMVHDLDMVYHIVGEVPTHLSSFGSSFLPGVAEAGDFDNVVASMTFPSGITASIDINRKSVFGYDQRIEAFGDAGMLQADNYHNTSLSQAGAGGFHTPPVHYSFPTRYREAYLNELKCFVRCAVREIEVPISHDDVRVNHLLASGLETAAKEKCVIKFDQIESGLHV
jgi:myo-inositol 2-dehydrogenase/D-chiro-inositol 1-dehydrogenase